MEFILEYAEYGGINLPKGIIITNVERMKINNLIKSTLRNIYPNLDDVSNFVANDKIIQTEYIKKAVNNYLLLKKIVLDPDRIIVSNVNNKEDLFNFIVDHSHDLFHYNGKYFNGVYNLLANTSKKGKKFEDIAFKEFEEMGRKKGMVVKILDPSVKEDISGVDGIFYFNSKKFTIQVKPLVSIVDNGDVYTVRCEGALKNLITHYLICINGKEVWIFRSSGITAHAEHYIIPKINLVQ